MKVDQKPLIFKANSNDNPQLTEEQKKSLLALVNTQDSDIKSLAKQRAIDEFTQTPTRKITNNIAKAIPWVDSFITGVTTPGNFSTKVLTSLDTGKDWAVFNIATNLYLKAINKLAEKFPGLHKFTEDHPVITLAGLTASGVYAGQKAIKAFNWALGKIFNVDQNVTLAQHFDLKYGGHINKLPGTSSLNNKILKPIEKFLQKPAIQCLGLIANIGLIGLIGKNIYDVYKMKQNSDNTYSKFKDMQLESSRIMLNQQAIKE